MTPGRIRSVAREPQVRTPITYVVSQWGKDTETFVRREASALAALGFPVSAVSLKRPGTAGSDVPTTCLTTGRVIVGVARGFVQRPGRAARIVGQVLRSASCRTVVPRLAAACVGLAWAGSGVVSRGSKLHAHFGWVAATAAWAAATMADASYTVVLHAFELHDARYQDRFVPIPLAGASTVFTISARDQALVAQRWGTETTVLRMGVPSAWAEANDPVDLDRRTITVVGSLTEKKGHRVLLEALRLTTDTWQCRIIGDGPLRRELERDVERLGLSSQVEFLGSRDENEIRGLLADGGVFCLPCVEASSGDRDGIPVAIMEAMAVGLPVVTTRVSAIPELVDGVGILVEPNDPAELAQAVDRLLDRTVRCELSRSARQRVRASWTIEASAAQLARCFAA